MDADLLGLDGHLVGQRLRSVEGNLKTTIDTFSSYFEINVAYFVSSSTDFVEKGRCVEITNIFNP